MPRPRTVEDEQILIAAAQAVGAVGPAHLTLADVGSRVGLSPATLLQRFGSKRGLLLALASHGADAMPNSIRSAAEAEDPLAALVRVMTGFASSVTTVSDYANHLSFLLMDLSDPEFQRISQRHAQAVHEAIEEVLTAAAAGGHVVLDHPVTQLAQLVHVVYNGALVTWGMDPQGSAQDAVASALTAVITSSTTTRGG
jgi:AcrR family transcriptional regulator